MTLAIVSRAAWGAAPPRDAPKRMALPSKRLWLHHTAEGSWRGMSGMRSCQSFHMRTRRYNDIAYSFVVDLDGTIYEGRGPGIVGAHTEGDNDESHAICCFGDFRGTTPPDVMVASIAALVRHGHDEEWWGPVLTGGHTNAPGAQTECPGSRLLAKVPLINALATGEDDDDMAWSEKDSANLDKAVRLLESINHQLSGDARLKAIASDLDRIADKIVRPD